MRCPRAIEVFTMYSPPDETAKWRMMLSPILWAGLALGCIMLTGPTRAAAASDDRRASSAPANAGSATAGADSAIAGASPVRHTPNKSQRTGDRRPPLLNTQARGRPAGQTSRPIGSNRAAIGVPGLGGPGASKRNAVPVPKATAVTTNSPIGGPRAQTIGRLGGPAVGRTNHSAAIAGTQFRPKF
jgi:hypothetical protein